VGRVERPAAQDQRWRGRQDDRLRLGLPHLGLLWRGLPDLVLRVRLVWVGGRHAGHPRTHTCGG